MCCKKEMFHLPFFCTICDHSICANCITNFGDSEDVIICRSCKYVQDDLEENWETCKKCFQQKGKLHDTNNNRTKTKKYRKNTKCSSENCTHLIKACDEHVHKCAVCLKPICENCKYYCILHGSRCSNETCKEMCDSKLILNCYICGAKFCRECKLANLKNISYQKDIYICKSHCLKVCKLSR